MERTAPSTLVGDNLVRIFVRWCISDEIYRSVGWKQLEGGSVDVGELYGAKSFYSINLSIHPVGSYQAVHPSTRKLP